MAPPGLAGQDLADRDPGQDLEDPAADRDLDLAAGLADLDLGLDLEDLDLDLVDPGWDWDSAFTHIPTVTTMATAIWFAAG